MHKAQIERVANIMGASVAPAVRVIMHSRFKRLRGRGKAASLWFGGERNPRLAIIKARKSISDGFVAEDYRKVTDVWEALEAITRLVMYANLLETQLIDDVGLVSVTVNPGDGPYALVEEWFDRDQRRQRAERALRMH